MGRRRGGCILMALGVVVALIAGGVTFFLVASATARSGAAVPTRGVLVAAVNIPERTLINPSMLRVQQWPQDLIPPGALAAIEEGANKLSTVPLFAGQALLESQVADTKGASGVAYALGREKVLVAVNLGRAGGLVSTGAVRAGDTIDIVVNTPGARGNQVAMTMQNLKIYAIGSVGAAGTKGAATGGSLFLFQVSPQDALVLKFLENLDVDIFLRPAGDETIASSEPVTLEYLINKYRLQRPPGQ